MMNFHKIFLIGILIVSLGSCSSSNSVRSTSKKTEKISGYKIDFFDASNLSEVLDEAAATNKLIYVDIGAKWCLPCKMMKDDVYTDSDIGNYINSNFVSYLVDGEINEGPDLALIYGVEAYPTLLFLDTKGRVLERKVGATYHTELRKLGNSAIAKNKAQSN